MLTWESDNHSFTIPNVSDRVITLPAMAGFVEILTNEWRVVKGKPTRSSPERMPSSQNFAAL